MPVRNKEGLIVSSEEKCPACGYPRDEINLYSIGNTKQSFYMQANKRAFHEPGFVYTFTCQRCSYEWKEISKKEES